jgi:hypothetical protein
MDEKNEKRLEALKTALGSQSKEQNALLSFTLDTVESLILRYINWERLPQELENILILISAAYFKSSGLGSTENPMGAVTSVKRGDVTTSFSAPSGGSLSAGMFNLADAGNDFFGWKTVLNQYRKLRW